MRVTPEEARQKLCPYTSHRCMAERCMKWQQVIPGAKNNLIGYCLVDVGKLERLERLESIINGPIA